MGAIQEYKRAVFLRIEPLYVRRYVYRIQSLIHARTNKGEKLIVASIVKVSKL
ncbi:hypothetical protein [Heyndrickxia oleronia]|jgi:hypothetical protein|uniref:hypothetical protein n=1 Tax=Heyndrickxia oleronia TaxID=38875 RepID=UPI002431C4F4|nr:hypothetical protein [Heyndrickxia oleronia]MCI1760435.1 hypothetical protein [Heyndrickxia oleronia]